MGPPARDLAQFLNRANETNAPERGVTLSKILGDDRANLLIVVGNQTGYHRMTKLSRHICLHGCFGAEGPATDDLPGEAGERGLGDPRGPGRRSGAETGPRVEGRSISRASSARSMTRRSRKQGACASGASTFRAPPANWRPN
jgi:hypothetical protein